MGWRRSLIKRLVGRLPVDPAIAVDPGNGFGGKSLLRSSLTGLSSDGPVLDQVQILTRFCAIEEPYWKGFVRHYQRLGVRRLHVCVQTDADAEIVKGLRVDVDLEVVVHRTPGEMDPASALRSLPLASLNGDGVAPFTLMVDCDESLQVSRSDLPMHAIFEIYPDCGQLFVPWLMRPMLAFDQSTFDGYWGHIAKPVAVTGRMHSLKNDHSFRLDGPDVDHRQASRPVGMFGLSCVHFWSRSFRDALLKTFFNRFVDAKSVDLPHAHRLIRDGDLPVRLRLLAFLLGQEGEVAVNVHPSGDFDAQCEEFLLRQFLSSSEEELCWDVFQRYRKALAQVKRDLPIYPAMTIAQIAPLLPSMSDLHG